MERKVYEEAVGRLREFVENNPEFSGKVYLVGGCVRDLLLGEVPKDIDLCIDTPEGSERFIEYLEKTYPRDVVSGFTVFKRYGTSRFTLHLSHGEEVGIECVIPRTETYNQGPRKPDSIQQTSIEEDASRRDFCCNALYKNLETGDLLDPTGRGLEDIKERQLQTPLPPQQTFIDDPLRMLRAVRFSCTKGFSIPENLKETITNCSKELKRISRERVQDEFTKIIMSLDPWLGIKILNWTKLMKYIIPEFVIFRDFQQHSKYHSLSWLDHSVSVFLKVLQANPEASLELRLAALLHDISKPKKYQVKEDGSYTYHGHEKDSASRAREILENLKYPGNVIDRVCFLIENHMVIKQFYSYRDYIYTGTPKQTRKILGRLGGPDNIKDLMELIDADNLSHSQRYNMPGQVDTFWQQVEELKDVDGFKEKDQTYSVPITGDDIMDFLAIRPSKLVKEIKNILQDYYYSNPFLEKNELLGMYAKEYGGQDIWFARFYEGMYGVFQKKPIKSSGMWIQQKTDIPPFQVKKEDITFPEILDNELIEVSPLCCPIIYKKFKRYIELRKIVSDRILNGLLQDLDGKDIESMNMSFDGGDLYIKFNFNDGTNLEFL